MKDFVLIFRVKGDSDSKPTPEQIQERMNWLAGIAAQNKLVDKGNSLSHVGAKVVKGGLVTDGPYTELKEFVSGYMIVRAESVGTAHPQTPTNGSTFSSFTINCS